jgi:hypothetical protein
MPMLWAMGAAFPFLLVGWLLVDFAWRFAFWSFTSTCLKLLK